MLRGLPDQSIALDLLTKRITTMTEAIHQVVLCETYKRGSKDRHVRQIQGDDLLTPAVYMPEETCQEIEVRKVGGKRYVTEERLNQFERDIKDSITSSIHETITKSVGDIIQDEMRKMSKPRPRPITNGERRPKITCYSCQEEGHIKRNCPNADKVKNLTQNYNSRPKPNQQQKPLN